MRLMVGWDEALCRCGFIVMGWFLMSNSWFWCIFTLTTALNCPELWLVNGSSRLRPTHYQIKYLSLLKGWLRSFLRIMIWTCKRNCQSAQWFYSWVREIMHDASLCVYGLHFFKSKKVEENVEWVKVINEIDLVCCFLFIPQLNFLASLIYLDTPSTSDMLNGLFKHFSNK